MSNSLQVASSDPVANAYPLGKYWNEPKTKYLPFQSQYLNSYLPYCLLFISFTALGIKSWPIYLVFHRKGPNLRLPCNYCLSSKELPALSWQALINRHWLTGSDNLKNGVASKDKNKPFMVLWSKQASISCYVKTFGKVLNFVTGMTNGPNPWAQVKAPMSSCKHLSLFLSTIYLLLGWH